MLTRQVIDLPNSKHIVLEVLDARTILLTTNVGSIVHSFSDNTSRVTYLRIADEISIDLNSPFNKFLFKVSDDRALVYEIKHIKRMQTGKYVLLTHKRTVCSYFLPPMLGTHKSMFGWKDYFINAYFVQLPESTRPNGMQYCIGMLYRFIPTQAFIQFEHELKKHSQYLFNYEMDTQTTLMVFRARKEQESDMHIIASSQYSKLSDKFKKSILSFHDFSDVGDMAQVLYKSKVRQEKLQLEYHEQISDDVELFEAVDHRTEIITINDYGK